MNILIDTHIFLWLAAGELDNIGAERMKMLEDGANKIYLSSLSIAEISIKVSIGKLSFNGNILSVLKSMDIEILDFDRMSALRLMNLPFYHRDPFDRMIISQSLEHNIGIVTNDSKFGQYGCELI